MDLMRKFNKLQYEGVLERESPQPSAALAAVHAACDPGPLLLDVAGELSAYLADSLVNATDVWKMIAAADWTRETRERVAHAYVVELIERFIDGNPDTAMRLRLNSIEALACFVANQTDIAYYHPDDDRGA